MRKKKAARLAGHFEALFRSLADGRAQFLPRENDAPSCRQATSFRASFARSGPPPCSSWWISAGRAS